MIVLTLQTQQWVETLAIATWGKDLRVIIIHYENIIQ